MDEIFTQTVLRCDQCNKPFDTSKQLKRHGYYCQSRRRGPTSRARACLRCATSKVVCDKVLPSCTRCITRNIKCDYLAKTTKDTDLVTRRPRKHEPPTEATDSQDSLLVEPVRSVSSDFRMVDVLEDVLPQDFDSSLDILDPTDLSWLTPTFDFADLWNASTGEKTLYPSPGFGMPHFETSTLLGEQTAISFNMSIPATINDPRSLTPRPSATAIHQRTIGLIFSTFRSYPLMMVQQNTLPPFIHPGILQSALNDSQVEPLTTCINILQMLSKKLRGSRQLFWRNVRMECDRWYANVRCTFSFSF